MIDLIRAMLDPFRALAVAIRHDPLGTLAMPAIVGGLALLNPHFRHEDRGVAILAAISLFAAAAYFGVVASNHAVDLWAAFRAARRDRHRMHAAVHLAGLAVLVVAVLAVALWRLPVAFWVLLAYTATFAPILDDTLAGCCGCGGGPARYAVWGDGDPADCAEAYCASCFDKSIREGWWDSPVAYADLGPVDTIDDFDRLAVAAYATRRPVAQIPAAAHDDEEPADEPEVSSPPSTFAAGEIIHTVPGRAHQVGDPIVNIEGTGTVTATVGTIAEVYPDGSARVEWEPEPLSRARH